MSVTGEEVQQLVLMGSMDSTTLFYQTKLHVTDSHTTKFHKTLFHTRQSSTQDIVLSYQTHTHDKVTLDIVPHTTKFHQNRKYVY